MPLFPSKYASKTFPIHVPQQRVDGCFCGRPSSAVLARRESQTRASTGEPSKGNLQRGEKLKVACCRDMWNARKSFTLVLECGLPMSQHGPDVIRILLTIERYFYLFYFVLDHFLYN